MEKKYFIILVVFGILILSIYITFSMNNRTISKNMFGDILEIDEDAYGVNNFDNTNLDLRPILDEDIDKKINNVIYIEFNVGGSKKNNIDNIFYDIALNDLEIDCNLLNQYVKWKLFKNDSLISSGSLDYRFDTIIDGRLVLTNEKNRLVPYNDDKSIYDHYKFYLWISDSCQSNNLSNCLDSEDQSSLLNKKLKGKIEIELYGDTGGELIRKPSSILDTNTCLSG